MIKVKRVRWGDAMLHAERLKQEGRANAVSGRALSGTPRADVLIEVSKATARLRDAAGAGLRV